MASFPPPHVIRALLRGMPAQARFRHWRARLQGEPGRSRGRWFLIRLNLSHQSGFLRSGKELQPDWHSPVGLENFRAAQTALDQSAGLDLPCLRLGWTNRINVKEHNKWLLAAASGPRLARRGSRASLPSLSGGSSRAPLGTANGHDRQRLRRHIYEQLSRTGRLAHPCRRH